MTTPFLDSLNTLGRFSDHELDLLQSEFKDLSIAKNELLLDEGQICRSIYFVLEGALYQFEETHDLDEKIVDLHIINDWAINTRSLTLQKPSTLKIKAFTDCKLLEITLDSLHRLIASSQSFLQIGKLLEGTSGSLDLIIRYKTPDERYLHILNNKPGIVRTFPQKIVASYLGITPETLSRVRKRIS